ncbi:hypothetical protein Plhal304r1_c013g0049161 [Plasmopara halstedii]
MFSLPDTVGSPTVSLPVTLWHGIADSIDPDKDEYPCHLQDLDIQLATHGRFS